MEKPNTTENPDQMRNEPIGEEKNSTVQKSLNLQKTGPSAKLVREKESWYRLTTLDLLIGAILGVMGGFISGLIPFSLLVKTWYPFVGGTQLVSGHHLLWMIVAYGLTKKKMIIFISATIKGLIEFLLGSQWGALEIFISLYEGLFLFLGILIIQLIREENTFVGWGLAGGIGNAAQVPLFWIVMTGKYFIIDHTLFWMALMFGFLSGVVITGLLGKLITNNIEKSQILT